MDKTSYIFSSLALDSWMNKLILNLAGDNNDSAAAIISEEKEIQS
ncbi:MAG: hypothetical protein WA667_08200 [Candidatus Nitrosopolaris sp.]